MPPPFALRAELRNEPPHFGHRRRDGEDHDPLQHLDDLLGHHRVDREAALRERREEQRGEHDAGRVVPPDERDGDAEKPGAAREAVFVIVLVAEHEVDAAEPGERPARGERAEPDAPGANARILRRVRLEADGAQLVARARAEQIPPHAGRGASSTIDDRPVRRRSVKRGERRRTAARHLAGTDLRRVQRFRHMQLGRDEIIEQRQHDEVQHDRHDHFVRAESRAQEPGHAAHRAARGERREHAERHAISAGVPAGSSEPHEPRAEPARRQLTLRRRC